MWVPPIDPTSRTTPGISCWQIVPRNIGELFSHPKAMQAMMGMIKMDLHALEAAADEN